MWHYIDNEFSYDKSINISKPDKINSVWYL